MYKHFGYTRCIMDYAIGLVLALLVTLFARLVAFDRDRSFYPVVLIIIASYYVLFAVMGGSVRALILESVVMSGFVVVATIGMKRHLWLVAGALAAHGVLDFFHGHLVNNPGVPEWWPAFCLAFDVVAAAVMVMNQKSARPSSEDRHYRAG